MDFCLLTSSLSAVLGGLGQIADTAASLYVDAFAERQTESTRVPWLSVDWDAVKFDDESQGVPLSAALAEFALSTAEGVEAARRILTQATGSPIVVSTGDLRMRMAQRPSASLPTHAPEGKSVAALHPRPALPTPYVAPRTEFEKNIVGVWQKVLGIDSIGIDDNFFELGGNSLIAVQTIAQLKKTLHVEVPAAMLYQKPTVRHLAELLSQDEDEADRQRSEKLAKRKEELGRRSQVLQQRRK